MQFNIIWKLSGEPMMYLTTNKNWSEKSKEAMVFGRSEAYQIASDIGNGARVCLALWDANGGPII